MFAGRVKTVSHLSCRARAILKYFCPLIRIVEATKITFISLPINLNMYFGCSKEPSHRDGSFEYPEHMFWLRNKKNNFPVHTLIWRPEVRSPNVDIIWAAT